MNRSGGRCAIAKGGPESFLRRTHDYWHLWLNAHRLNLNGLSHEVCDISPVAHMIQHASVGRWEVDGTLDALLVGVHPYFNAPLSVSPLTRSHAAFVTTVQAYLQAR